MTWIDVLKLAAPIAGLLGLIVWALIVRHGDERWSRKGDDMDDAGKPKWASSHDLNGLGIKADRNEKMVLAHYEKSADHEGRLIRLEERDQNVLPHLRATMDRIVERMDDLADVPRRLAAIERRLDHMDQRP